MATRLVFTISDMTTPSIISGLLCLWSFFSYAHPNSNEDNFSAQNYVAEANSLTPKCCEKTSKKYRYERVKDNIIEMRNWCGSLCNDISGREFETNIESNNSIYLPIFKKIPITCESLWNTSVFEENNPFEYPIQILPKYLMNYYSYSGEIRVTPHYYADLDTENHASNTWCTYPFYKFKV